MGRIVDTNREFASLSCSPHGTICMKELAIRIGEASRNVSCSGQLRVDCAENNSDMSELLYRLQLRLPVIVLERSLCNQRHATFE